MTKKESMNQVKKSVIDTQISVLVIRRPFGVSILIFGGWLGEVSGNKSCHGSTLLHVECHVANSSIRNGSTTATLMRVAPLSADSESNSMACSTSVHRHQELLPRLQAGIHEEAAIHECREDRQGEPGLVRDLPRDRVRAHGQLDGSLPEAKV